MLITSELQFGINAKYSTCTLILKEAVSYVNNDSSVFCTFQYAKKAFDGIRNCRLFCMLIDRGIPPCIIRVLLGFDLNNMIRVAWNGILSGYFLAVNGVNQGGVLSPVMFQFTWFVGETCEGES